MRSTKRATGFKLIYLLLLLPFAVMLWVGLYNRAAPEVFGIPFFYWFQLICIPLGALLIWPVFVAENRAERRNDDARSGGPE